MKSLLLVEDDTGHAELMRRALEGAGHRVRVAGSLVEARAEIAARAPVLVLVDYQLPDGAGSELIATAAGAFPILLMTAHGDEGLAVDAIKAGAMDYLVKSPATFTELPHTVERALREWALELERRQMLRALHESEERYRRITEGLTDYLYSVRLEAGRAVATTHGAACAAVTGYTAEEFAADPFLWMNMIVPDDRARVIAHVERVLAGERLPPVEHRIVRKDGQTRWVSDTSILHFDAEGRLVGYDGVIRDTTERKKLEAQSLRAQRLESLGALASGVAHDLNNVLAPLLMSVELLRPLARNQEDRDMLQLLNDSARRGADIVQQLLLFGRGSDSPRAPLNAGDVVKEVGRMMRQTFPKDLILSLHAAADLWLIEADRTQIHQVILNLCVNARDAMAHGGRLAVVAENRQVEEAFAKSNGGTTGGPHVLIQVKDSGKGIPAADLEKIFDPFFTTKPVGEGTGLGLPTVLGIVRSHGGFVSVTSQENLGSVFEVFLPAAGSAVAAPPGASGASNTAGGGECVLVVEDEEGIRSVLQRLLTGHNYQVLVASDGAEALGVFAQNVGKVKLVVTDVMMPVMNGAQMVNALRRLNADLPVVAISGLPSHRAEFEKRFGPRIRFLPKPFTSELALRTIREALDTTGVAPGPAG